MKTKKDFIRNEQEFYQHHRKAVLSTEEAFEIVDLCNEEAEARGESKRSFENGAIRGVLHAYAAGYRYGYKAGKRK